MKNRDLVPYLRLENNPTKDLRTIQEFTQRDADFEVTEDGTLWTGIETWLEDKIQFRKTYHVITQERHLIRCEVLPSYGNDDYIRVQVIDSDQTFQVKMYYILSSSPGKRRPTLKLTSECLITLDSIVELGRQQLWEKITRILNRIFPVSVTTDNLKWTGLYL